MNNTSVALGVIFAGIVSFGECSTVCALSPASPDSTTSSPAVKSHVKSLTAINEVFGDGQKISAVAVEYDAAINTTKLKPSDFVVEDKKITRVYANTVAAKAAHGINGRFVIIELSTAMTADDNAMGGGGGSPDAGPGKSSSGSKTRMGGPPANGGGPQMGSRATDSSIVKPLTANVTQVGILKTVQGKAYKAISTLMTTTHDIDLVVSDFKQLVYTAPKFSDGKLMYNLFVPKNYNPAKKYPLVLFMSDAGGVSNNPKKTLTQGLGAVIWATPSESEQARHECFVLAPQYQSVIVSDESQTTDQMDVTIDLVKSLQRQYSIDPNRIYNTGQSMGGMTSIAMDIKYPHFFAASLLVACQWDATKVDPMAKANLWIVVSAGDDKAYPGMQAITAELKKKGATVSEATCSAEASAVALAAVVSKVLAAKCNVNFLVFKGGNHRYTWEYAYGIEGLRDWMFSQVKASEQ